MTGDISSELVRKYNLPVDIVEDAVSDAVASTLQHALRTKVFPVLGAAGMEIYVESTDQDSLEVVKLVPSRLSRKLQRHLRYNIEKALYDRKVREEFETHRGMRGQIIRGAIKAIRKDGDIEVEIETLHLFERATHFALYHLRHQPPHERGRYAIDQHLSFHVTRVEPKEVRGMPRLEIHVARTSPVLTEGLLRANLAGAAVQVKCWKRIPGAFSKVWSDTKIDKDIIRKVSGELRESVVVRYGGQG